MATDYSGFVALAQRLIENNGRSVTMQRHSAGVADPSKPWKGPGVPTIDLTKNVQAVFLPAGGNSFGKNFISSELLERCEQVCMVAPTDISLEGFTAILDNGSRWQIEWGQVLRPGPVIVLYAFGVKR